MSIAGWKIISRCGCWKSPYFELPIHAPVDNLNAIFLQGMFEAGATHDFKVALSPGRPVSFTTTVDGTHLRRLLLSPAIRPHGRIYSNYGLLVLRAAGDHQIL